MNTDLRPALIGGNWKLNGMPGDCRAFAAELAKKAGYTEKAVLSSDGIQFVAL